MIEISELSLEPLPCGTMMGQLVVSLQWGSGISLEPYQLLRKIGSQMNPVVKPVVIVNGSSANAMQDISEVVRGICDITQVITVYQGDSIPTWSSGIPTNRVLITGSEWIEHRVMELYWLPNSPEAVEPHPGSANLRVPRKNEVVHNRYVVIRKGWDPEHIAGFIARLQYGWRIISEQAFFRPAFKKLLE